MAQCLQVQITVLWKVKVKGEKGGLCCFLYIISSVLSDFSYAILPNIYSVQYSNDVVAAK